MSRMTPTFVLNFNRCNQGCLFCVKEGDLGKKEKPTYEEISRQIIGAKKAGYRCVDFFGGEPTCFPFLKKAVALANKQKIKVTLATNALKFSSRAYADAFFSDIAIDSIRTTLHHHTPKIHDTVTRTSGSFAKTLKGIGHILEHNKNLTVNIVITSLNYKDLVPMARFIHAQKVRKIKFAGLAFYGGAVKNSWLCVSPEITTPHLFEAIQACKQMRFLSIQVEKFPDSLRDLFRRWGGIRYVDDLETSSPPLPR